MTVAIDVITIYTDQRENETVMDMAPGTHGCTC